MSESIDESPRNGNPNGQTREPSPTASAAASSSADDTLTAGTIASASPRTDALSSLPVIVLAPLHASDHGTVEMAVVTTLGEGGMGRVHLVRQRSLARDVAVKTLKPDASPSSARALLHEARVTGILEHPGVIPVHALGVDDDGRPVMVMKRVEGVDLATRLGGRPQTGEDLVWCLEVLIQVCRTLEFAHARGIVHRDIKPSNIMTGAFGEVYLLDWGVATTLNESASGRVVGTPCYLAPELAAGRGVDARADVYLVGATLHEILTGTPRHMGGTIGEVLSAAMASAPVEYGTEVPAELADLCNRATARDPADRPTSAAELRAELGAFLRNRGARALADAARERLDALEHQLRVQDGPPADLVSAYRRVTEARFGFAQALREGAAAARAGLRRTLIAAIELELRQDHVDSAAALMQELDPPDPDLNLRVEQHRESLAHREQVRVRLEQIARDLDPTARAGRRKRYLVLLATLLALVGGVTATRWTTLTTESLLAAGVACAIAFALSIVAFRRVMGANGFNRRGRDLMCLAMGALLANRGYGHVHDLDPVSVLTLDLWVLALASLAGATMLFRPLWLAALPPLVGIVALDLWPRWATPIFGLAAFLVTVLVALALTRARRAYPEGRSPACGEKG